MAGEVSVWRVDLRQRQSWVKKASQELLEPRERKRAARGTPEVRRRRIVSRAALRIALAARLGRPPASLRFASDRHGKPILAPSPGRHVHFSLSTSGDCCLIALSAVGPVGVDLERIVAFPELEELVRSRFAPSEAAAIVRLPREKQLRAFYNCWTRKEACLKATGVGLTRGLDAVAVTVDDRRPALVSLDGDDPRAWMLAALHPGADLVGAVAARRPEV
jgi:4'-phosphopantetheinyl transferase